MKCVNKKIIVEGVVGSINMKNLKIEMEKQPLDCMITNDKNGKTLSISNGDIMFSIPFEPLEKYLR